MRIWSLSVYSLVFLILSLVTLTTGHGDFSRPDGSRTLWGPYRPHLYFGLRPQAPHAVTLGMMWARNEDGEVVQQDLRHSCEPDNGVTSFGWTLYDPRIGGSQTISDQTNAVDIKTQFVRLYDQKPGDWAVRVRGVPHPDAGPRAATTVILYVAFERDPGTGEGMLQCTELANAEARNTIECQGRLVDFNHFNVIVQDSSENLGSALDRSTVISGAATPGEWVWWANALYLGSSHSHQDPEVRHYDDNVHFIERTYRGAFEFDILYSSNETALSPTTSDNLGHVISEQMSRLGRDFDKVFQLSTVFQSKAYHDFARTLLSDLLSGLGYFHGDSVADTTGAREYDESEPQFWSSVATAHSRANVNRTGPSQLLSVTSSRSSSAFGSWANEGYHLLVLLDWDLDLALEITHSWLDLMSEQGWVASEQILGAEARSHTKVENHIQYPHIASPPSIFFVIEAFLQISASAGQILYAGHPSHYLDNPMAGNGLLMQLYPLLKRYYNWFLRTQLGAQGPYARPGVVGYRWRGRKPGYCSASSMYDYPRPEPPHPGELHVDALSWVGYMAATLRKLANYLGEEVDLALYVKQERAILDSLEKLHWSEDEQAYCDATMTDGKHTLVCHKGYLSLMPFALGLLGLNHKHLGPVLNLIKDQRQILSKHGVRSLSRSDRLYGIGENQWRGGMFVHMNYLILDRLLGLMMSPGPYRKTASEIYTPLRQSVIRTVFQSWQDTGTVWERYNSDTGAGEGSSHWTGWTALVLRLMCMPDIKREQTPPVDLGREYDQEDLETAFMSGSAVKRGIVAVGILAFMYVSRRKIARLLRRESGLPSYATVSQKECEGRLD